MRANRLALVQVLFVLAACGEPTGPADPVSSPRAGSLAVPTAPVQSSCQATPAGLVAWWHADGDGTDAVGANPATPRGAVGYAPGHAGQAFALDGASYLEVPDAPALDLAGSFTVDFWFEPQSTQSWWFEGLIGKRDPATDLANFGVNFNPSFLGLGAYYNDPAAVGGDDYDAVGSSFEAIRLLPTPAPGAFHHFAAVYRQASIAQVELRMFVDGQLVRARTIDGDLARTVNDAPLTLGASYPDFELFTGLLDEVRIFGRALSDAEVAALPSASGQQCGPAAIEIDIQPGDPANRLPCRNPNALVTVAVLSTDAIDASRLDPGSARFGPGQAAEVHRDRNGAARLHLEDVNGDGRRDLVLHFRMADTGLGCTSTEAALLIGDGTGATFQGTGSLTPGS